MATLFFFFFFFIITPYATSLDFNFPNIGPSNADQFIVAGDASITSEGIQLTPDPSRNNASTLRRKVGRATYTEPLHLWDKASGTIADFTTYFSFYIQYTYYSNLGEGLAFFLAPTNSTIPPNSTGGYLGLTNQEQAAPFVSVEFDTYRNNEWEGTLPFNHVGININFSASLEYRPWDSNFSVGVQHQAWIRYNSSSRNLSVVFTIVQDDRTTRQDDFFHIVDLREVLPEWVTLGFSGSTGDDASERNDIKSWEFSSSLQIDDRRDENRTGLVVGLSVGSCAVVAGLALVGFFLWRRKRSRGERGEGTVFGTSMDEEFERGTGPRKFSYGDLARATNNFAEEVKLGEGGFGGVYRGLLEESGSSYVAVKRISSGSKQGLKEYASEVRIISQVRHKNLVRLIGWCHEKKELLLVYEFMPNGSLDFHLFRASNLLAWELRYKIAQGVASALFYLHEEWELCVLHRDIKSSNVMLDSNFTAKLGDFGLARLVDHEDRSPTTDIAGTMGYMAPEYMATGKASKETDVYSFGIMALEIACGRKAIDLKAQEHQTRLVEWVWDLYESRMLLEAADKKLGGDFDEQEMECLMIVGLWCAHPDCNLRPTMRQATLVLNFESPLPILPSKTPHPTNFGPPTQNMPTYSISSSSAASAYDSSQNKPSSYSHNSMSSRATTSSAVSSTSLLRTK